MNATTQPLPSLREAVELIDTLMAQAYGHHRTVLPAWYVVKRELGQVRTINSHERPGMRRRMEV